MRDLIFPPFVEGRGAVGLFVLRVFTGAAFITHGLEKIQTPTSWAKAEENIPEFAQAIAAVSEFGGGICLLLGLLTPLAAFGILNTMGGALTMHILRGHTEFRSFEPAAFYFCTVIMFLLIGPGTLSLDALLFRKRATPPPG